MNEPHLELAVAGLHLSGQRLNHQLIDLGATLHQTTFTAAKYKMYLIEDEKGIKPSLIRISSAEKGHSYEVEVWKIPMAQVGKFIAAIPAPLGIGTIELDDETRVKGFICEPIVLKEGKDISGFTGWRSYLSSMESREY